MSEEKLRNKIKKVEGRFATLKVAPYRGCPIYTRLVDNDMFEYLIIFDNQIYADYIIVTLEKGQKKLTNQQIIEETGLIFASACTTVDTLIDIRKEEIATQPAKVNDRSVN